MLSKRLCRPAAQRLSASTRRHTLIAQQTLWPYPKTPIQAVALDLDGTVLDPQNKVHPRVRAAIQTASGLGVPIFLSTGRCPEAATKLVNRGSEQAMPTSGGVFLGGALAVNSFGKIVRDITLPGEVVEKVLAHTEEWDLTAVIIHHDDFFCVARDRWTEWLVQAGDPRPVGLGKDGLVKRARKANLLCLMGEQSVVDEVEVALTELLRDADAHIVRPFDFMLDVIPGPDVVGPGAGLDGKAAALAELCSARGVPADAVMAIGDSGNDVGMMRWAGWAVAMGNSKPSVLAEANVVVARNDDLERPGVAEALEEFVIALK